MAIASQNLIEPLESPVTPPTNPTADPTEWGFAGLDIRQLAAAGYFRAIAYWLNEPLVPQKVYAQVLADEIPGRIKVLVEFERVPQSQRLIRFVCDRIYRLNSDVIEGIHLIARALGTGQPDWEQSIRIPTAAQRQQKQAKAKDSTQPTPQTSPEEASQAQSLSPKLVHESARSQVARQIVRSQFKFFRAALISGTAAAAFLFGGLTELMLADRLSVPVADSTAAVPWYGESAADPSEDFSEATTVSFRSASRFKGRTVEAALETVAVIPHDEVAQPDDPTVTLLFGGELSLNDFVFEEADSLDRLFAEVSLYQQADVAMLGLAEPLAYASTSLQENFYHRTRPQAVQTLKAGGIDIVSLASEGTLTYGTQGLSETLKALDQQGIYRVGAGLNQQEAHRPEILEVKGQRIAYLGYNPEAVMGAQADRAGVALANSEEQQYIIEDIRAIRPQVDWIVVNYRWGDTAAELGDSQQTSPEHASPEPAESSLSASMPADWQKALAREAVDAGADLVVGYHPNQIQGAEIYRDRAIAYSLGDFVFSSAPLADHDTAALKVSLRNHQMKVEFLPVTIQDSHLQMATGEHGAAILQAIREASKSFDQPMHFPTVLEAKPIPVPATPKKLNVPATNPASDDIEDSLAPELPEIAPSEPTTSWPPEEINELPKALESDLEPADASENGLEGDLEIENDLEYDAPARYPILQESEALFAPESDESAKRDQPSSGPSSADEGSSVDNSADDFVEEPADKPVDGPWQDEKLLEDWGEKQPGSWRDVSPIIEEGEEPAQPEGSIDSEELTDDRRSDAGDELESSDLYSDAPSLADPLAVDAAADLPALTPTDQADPIEQSVEQPSEPGAIAPYAEPLVGPLSALPAANNSN